MASTFISRLESRYPAARSWTIAGLLVLIGLVMRCLVVGKFSLNSDEAWHLNTASQGSYGGVLSLLFAEELHPPLNYLLLHAFLPFSGNLIALRSLFILPWMLWVVVCYRVGVQLGGVRHGLIWVGLAALCNGTLEYSLTVREYMWMLLFLTIQFSLFIQMCRQPSHRAILYYTLCGLLAIGFEFSAAIGIFVMGTILGWHMLKTHLKPLRLTVEIAASHLLQAAFCIWLYAQYSFHKYAHVVWYNSNYFSSSYAALYYLASYIVCFIILLPVVLNLLFFLLLLPGLKPLWQRAPDIAAFLCVSAVMTLILNYAHLYARPYDIRFITWMLPAVMTWLAFSFEDMYLKVRGKMRGLFVLATVAGMAWLSVMNFTISHAPTAKEFSSFLAATKKIQKDDLVFMDMQTMFKVKYHSDWSVVAHYPHVDEAKWEGRTVFYPNWHQLSLVDVSTRKRVGGVVLEQLSLAYFSQAMQEWQLDKPVRRVWILHNGYVTSLDKECEGMFDHFGTTIFRNKGGFITWFTPQAFTDFATLCPAELFPDL